MGTGGSTEARNPPPRPAGPFLFSRALPPPGSALQPADQQPQATADGTGETAKGTAPRRR